MDELEGTTTTATDEAPLAGAGEDTSGGDDGSTTPSLEAQAKPKEESFIDPSQLPDELKPHWKRMHGAYTKSREELKQGREAAAQVNRFYSDPEFALQTMQQAASKFGYQITKAGAPSQPSQTEAANGVPSHFVEKIRNSLSPELQWMAPQLANAQWAGVQDMVKPLYEKQAAGEQATKSAEYDALAGELDSKHPGWDEQEQEMNTVLQWLQGGTMKHPKYGNRLEAVYKLTQLLTGHNGAAVAEAARRMGDAARSRTTTGQVTRPNIENSADRVRKAKSRNEAWEIAAEVGLAEARRLGANV